MKNPDFRHREKLPTLNFTRKVKGNTIVLQVRKEVLRKRKISPEFVKRLADGKDVEFI